MLNPTLEGVHKIDTYCIYYTVREHNISDLMALAKTYPHYFVSQIKHQHGLVSIPFRWQLLKNEPQKSLKRWEVDKTKSDGDPLYRTPMWWWRWGLEIRWTRRWGWRCGGGWRSTEDGVGGGGGGPGACDRHVEAVRLVSHGLVCQAHPKALKFQRIGSRVCIADLFINP